MHLKPSTLRFRPQSSISLRASRCFSTSKLHQAPNRIYTSVRTPDELDTLLLLSASSNRPLITLWTASWCSSCKVIAPSILNLIKEGAGEKEGGVGYAEIELDSPVAGDIGMRYMITSIPTLLSFSRQEAQSKTRVTDVTKLKDHRFLVDWITKEAERGGSGGSGSSLFGALFGR